MATTKRLHRLTRAAVTAAAVMVAVAVGPVLYHVPAAAAVDAKSIRVASSNLITDPGTGQPTVVLSMYEDFLCPYCGRFERDFGSTVSKLIDTGAVAADYYFVAILDRGDRDYSSRAGAAAYCVADQSTDAFRRFHAALFAQQPEESASSFPDNSALIDSAQQAGAGDAIRFVRVGTLDEPASLPPDIHIYTMSKQPWLVLPPDVPAEPEFYKLSTRWPAESLQRRAELLEKFPRRP